MSLSPYIEPEAINGTLGSMATLTSQSYPEGLDKRNLSRTISNANTANVVIDTVSDTMNAIANTAGTRSPMYTIGEIPQEVAQGFAESNYVPDALSGLIRAVGSFAGNVQNGVIIDGLGNVDGTFAVELTSNPAFYKTNNIVDQRYRVPAKLNMVIMVSDFLNDNLVGTVIDMAGGYVGNQITEYAKNLLAYDGLTRSQYALTKLRWLMENAMPFTVYTPHGIYENMLIKSLKPQTDANKMSMLYCTVEFQEILFYTPYSNTPGRVPARRGVTQTSPGWTASAVVKISNLMGS